MRTSFSSAVLIGSLFVTLLAARCASAQSTPISVPPNNRLEAQQQQNLVASKIVRSPTDSAHAEGVITNRSAEHVRWEAILDQPFPHRFGKPELVARDVFNELKELGLPIIIDPSAQDDALSSDEMLTLALPEATLRTRLLTALRIRNATLVFREGHIAIISLDEAEDSKWLTTVVYDVELLNINTTELIQTIINSVAPDNWRSEGGAGTVFGSTVGDNALLTVSQSYEHQRAVAELLNGMQQLGGTTKIVRTPPANQSHSMLAPPAPIRGVSSAVEVPGSVQVVPYYPNGGVF